MTSEPRRRKEYKRNREMRLRFLYTNGERTVDLFWLVHKGSDIYCGPRIGPAKWSYHGSGKFHFDTGEERHGQWRVPLHDLEGSVQLLSFGFVNSPDSWLFDDQYSRVIYEDKIYQSEYKGEKGDTLLMIDGRTLPEGATINASIGLLEPGNLPAEAEQSHNADDMVKPVQITIATGIVPWVYVVLLVPQKTHQNEANKQGMKNSE